MPNPIDVVEALLFAAAQHVEDVTAREFVDHVALGRGEGLPIARCFYDVIIARQDPELPALAPVARKLLAQHFVIRKRVGVDYGRIKIESFHHGVE